MKFILVNSSGGSSQSDADALAEALSDDTNLVVKVSITDSYAEARKAVCSGEASVVSVDAFAYMSAIDQSCGEGLYTAELDGDTSTQGQMLAGLGRNIFSIQAFRGYRFCRPNSLSVNGWFLPTLSLKANRVNPLGDLDSVIDSGTDEDVIRDIIRFRCDVGASRVGAEVDIPGSNSVLIIEELPLVPNDTIMISSRIDARTRGVVADNLRDHLDDIADLIGADSLVAINDGDFDGLRKLFTDAGVDVVSMGN